MEEIFIQVPELVSAKKNEYRKRIEGEGFAVCDIDKTLLEIKSPQTI